MIYPTPKSAGLSLLALCLAAALASPAASEARRFTFAQAEFLPSAMGMARAQDFLAESLPPGLQMHEAIKRLREADMSCRAEGGPGAPVSCEYWQGVRPEGGDQGEDVWTVHLTPGPDGALQATSIDRSHIGMEGLIDE
jgi:hypothetical protein